MNHPHYTACKWQLGSNLLIALHFPLHHSCLWPRDTPQQPAPLVPPSEFRFNHRHGLLSSWIIKYRGFCLDWLWLLQSNSPLSKCFHTSFILTTFQVIPTNWKLYFRLNTRRTEWGTGRGAGGGRERLIYSMLARIHSVLHQLGWKGPKVLESPCTLVLPRLTDSWKCTRYKIPLYKFHFCHATFTTKASFNIWFHKKNRSVIWFQVILTLLKSNMAAN